jgi:hypothetical protein
MPNAPSRWEPYCHRPDAESHLSNFSSSVLGHDAGVIFFDGFGATRLKSASPDHDGDTTDLIVSTSRPPLFPFGFRGDAQSQSFSQVARQHAQGLLQQAEGAGSALKSAYGHAMAPVAGFIEDHKTAFDGLNTVADALGVMSGVVAAGAIFAEGIALAPALGVIAMVGAAMLLVADGTMFYFEVTGNEVRKKQLANSWAYKLVESVAPWLSVPDLARSGIGTLRQVPTATREVTALTGEAEAATQRLASQRDAIAAWKDAQANKLDRPNIMTKTQHMQAKANRLTGDMQRAHAKLQKASRELQLLRFIEAPAYVASTYGLSVYASDPPDFKDTFSSVSTAWNARAGAAANTHDPHHPAHLLVPHQLAPRIPGEAAPVLQFQVSVCPQAGGSK